MLNFKHLLWFAFAWLPFLATGQVEAPYFSRYSMEQGLDNWVHVAMRDSHGFLWFGTEGGLSRFDGQAFLNFYEQKNSSNSLSNNTVRDMCEDPDGSFWLAVLNGGINHFDPATGKTECWKTDPDFSGLNGELLSLTSICPDGDLLWLGSYHHGLGCFDKKKRHYMKWHTLQQGAVMENTFQFNSINHIIQDRHDPRYLWVAASGKGVARFDKTNHSFDFIDLKDSHGMGGLSAMKLTQDAQGKIWVATWSAGVAVYDPATRLTKTYPYDIHSWKKADAYRNVVLAILEKNDDELWVATEDNGFGILDKKSGQYRFFKNNLSGESPEIDRNCQGLYLDPEQRLWVLGVKGGVRAYDFQRQSFRYISLASGNFKTERAEVTAFAYAPQLKAVFLATENSGCFEWSDEKGRLVQRARPLSDGMFPSFRALLCDSKGNIWAGAAKTFGGRASLYRLRPDSKKEGPAFFEPVVLPFSPPKMIGETVNDILEDSKGNIWLATSYDGIYKIGPGEGEVTCFSNETGFSAGMPCFKKWWAFLDAKEAPNGHLWFALKSGGVMDFDPTSRRFVMYDYYNVLSYDNARSMEIANDGTVWVGTNNNGLEVFDPSHPAKASLKMLNEKDGLPGRHISSIEKDGAGNLWMTTDKGLAFYSSSAQQVNIFAKTEGLKDTYLKDKGLAVVPGFGVLIGQPNGFCILRNEAGPAPVPTPFIVVLTDFKVFYRSKYFEKNIRNAKEVVLAPSENVFAFEFATPTLLNANSVIYQFKLEGFDDKWYTAEGQKSITYSGLPPGIYTFRVKGKRPGEGPIGETALAIRILPNWWQTGWFWSVVVLACIIAVWAIVRFRIYQVRREEQMKTAFYKKLSETEMTALRSQMNPHFIFNCLNSINHFVVRNDSQQAANYISKFSKLIRLVLDNSRLQKVPLDKELEALQLYMDLEAMRFSGKFRYELWVDDEVDAQFTQIPSMLLQPYVENAIWHGLMHKPEGGSVVVDVKLLHENLLYIEITDDGVGRQRAAELESKTALQHKPQGTHISEERLRLLNPDNPNSGKVTIEDLVDAEGQPCGTKVVLEIPV